jgi:hypothetical protein
MVLQSVKITIINGNHINPNFEKDNFDILGWAVGQFKDLIFILDEKMMLVVFEADNIKIENNITACANFDTENTKNSFNTFDILTKYFNSIELLKDIMHFDIDEKGHVNEKYLKSHAEYYDANLKDKLEAK